MLGCVRALLQRAEVIVLDESFAELDPANLRLAIAFIGTLRPPWSLPPMNDTGVHANSRTGRIDDGDRVACETGKVFVVERQNRRDFSLACAL
jgi:hypothetical protein